LLSLRVVLVVGEAHRGQKSGSVVRRSGNGFGTFGVSVRHWYRSIQLAVLAVLAAGATAQAQQAPNQLGASVLAATAMPQTPPAPQLRSSDQDQGSAVWRFFRDGEWYFTWGYNKEYWAPSDVHVSQGALGNNFTIYGVQGHDEAGLSTDPFGPQYNFRIGRFVNDDRTIGVELNFDHTKFTSNTGQTAQVTGTIAGAPVNGNFTLGNPFFYEELHNGANHLMVNGVYRAPLIGQTNETLSVAAIAKAGVGVMLPHTTDTILGITNSVGNKTLSNSIGLTNGWWQLNGWTAGAEVGFRVVLYKPVYLELTDKVAYAHLSDLPAYQGTMQQSLWMNEIVLGLGFTYDGASNAPH